MTLHIDTSEKPYNFANSFKEQWRKLALKQNNKKYLESRKEFSVILLSDNTIL